MYSKYCPHCGCLMRKAPPSIIVVNDQVIYMDDPDASKIWTCLNPLCRQK